MFKMIVPHLQKYLVSNKKELFVSLAMPLRPLQLQTFLFEDCFYSISEFSEYFKFQISMNYSEIICLLCY